MKNALFPFLVALIFLALNISCDNNTLFEKYKSIPEAEWHKDSLLTFTIPVNDTLRAHNLLINVRNKMDYNFSNLWLFIEIDGPDGAAVKDTFEITLAGPSGKWLGEGFGGLKTRQSMYLRDYNFPEPGEYTIKIRHGMRQDLLSGISDVGFRVEKAGT